MKHFTFTLLYLSLVATSSVNAQLIDQSIATLTTKNVYIDRNYIGKNVPQVASKEWAQGLILNLNSGYTEGLIGAGVDLYAGLGIKLWGDAEHSRGTGMLPIDLKTGEPTDTFAEIAATVKFKYAETELKYGTLFPKTPVVIASFSRALPQAYRGLQLISKDLEKIKIEMTYLDQVNHRDSTNYEKIKLIPANGRFKPIESDHLYYIGTNYSLNPQTEISLFHANLDDIYCQYYLGLNHIYPMNNEMNLSTDFRYFRTVDTGQKMAGKIDNHHGNFILGLSKNNHKFSVGYIHNSGDTAFPYLSGGETATYMDSWATDFLNQNEKAYTIRYDYNFKDYVPGLKAMTRYTYGKDIRLDHITELKDKELYEKELGFDLIYQIQTGTFKGLNFRGRYANYDNNFGSRPTFKSANETRFNIDYTWKFK
ncbi:OprD family outer membrane porin [Acinetobacter sp. ANC 4648]|uniref:OprD family outer membrane porin n=1 Tax=Acinetobacter sp. ANC 4648 TaxID=1977875 RepID=UPI000A34B1AD|nr:OprD family outer membrane porin [Acinetobacter sp. ANC 4648]OTG80329.1 hypothetical protein B9T27_13250 [Acinetobacter sp. ANC 4648]